MDSDLIRALAAADTWKAYHAALALIDRNGIVAVHGDADRAFSWASVTKLVTALAVHVAVERGAVAYDESAGPPGSTVRHLLAHASGLGFEGEAVLARPGTMRIYSNAGYDRLGQLLAERSGRATADALHDSVLGPLGMTATRLVGRAAADLEGPLADLAALAGELLQPGLIAPPTHEAMTRVAFPGLVGVVPGVGRFDPCDWGLGPELRGAKTPHWTGSRNSMAAFGHFGGTGTFLWIEPARGYALACLTDRTFGPWALDAWPAISNAVIDVINGSMSRPT